MKVLKAAMPLYEYLQVGTLDRSYKEGDIPYVSETIMRELLIRAGYTEFALACLGWAGHTDLKDSVRWPQPPDHRIKVITHAKNRYGMEPGNYYDGVLFAKWLITHKVADLPIGKDPLQRVVIARLAQFRKLKERLHSSGKGWFSLGESWRFHMDGTVDFWLNPYDQTSYSFGWYTYQDLGGWLKDDQDCPVLMENQRKLAKQAEGQGHPSYLDQYKAGLARLAARRSLLQPRLMRIALLRCPFPSLVAGYMPKA